MEHTLHSSPADPVGEMPIQLTPKAVDMAKRALEKEGLQGWALRLGVVGGGCSGLSYNMNFDESPKSDDVVFEVDGLSVYVDGSAVQYLQGMTVDYVSGLHGAGFKFLNPNASRTCGCGSSFAV